MHNLDKALYGLFYAFMFAVGAAIILAGYVLWQTLFATTPWEICAKMESDTAKIQCMEAHYE